MTTKLVGALRQVASDLDAKRRPRVGLDSWYPYYAGFSEAFARSVLKKAPLSPGSIVMDPWNGSGTTTHVADRLGFSARGFDVNPVAALVANAKLARPRDAEHVSGLARRIVSATSDDDKTRKRSDDPLADWVRPSVARQYRRIEAAVLADLATGPSCETLRVCDGVLPPLASFLILALMRAARSLAAVATRTNPTWVTPAGESQSGTGKMLGARWLSHVHKMASELSLEGAGAHTLSEATIADARALPLGDESVDFVLTSPPYCTRIDYVINTSFELAAMGIARNSPEFAQLRAHSMGAPLARKGDATDPLASWPDEVKDLLSAVRAHPSRDSSSYYYKTYWQYFSDCEKTLLELKRVLRPKGAAVLVVQTSYYKDICVDLPDLYVALGASLGFRANVVNAIDVQHSLTQINSRSLRHRTSTSYREAVVALEKAA